MELKERLVLIDGNSLINRAYYALPLLTNKEGVPAGAVYGFATMLVRMIEEYAPRYIAVAFDVRAKTFRHKMYDGYKATRKGMPDDLAAQLPLLKEMLDAMGITRIEQEGIEADDVIGTIAKSHPVETLILTGDRDSFQLIDSSTSVLFTRRGITEVDVMTADSLKESMGLTPSQIVDYKALAGDSSDNIPGVPGIGDKRATELLQKYGDVRGIYDHLDDIGGKLREKLEAGRESCDLSYTLACIRTDCAVDGSLSEFTYRFPFPSEVMAFFEKMEFRSLVRRSELFGESVEAAAAYAPAEIIRLTSTGQLGVIAADAAEFSLAIGKDKLSLSTDGVTQYDVPLRVTLLDDAPSEADAIAVLKSALENERVTKYLYDAKSVRKYLAGYGVCLRGYEDVALMEYLDGSRAKLTSPAGFAESLGLPADNGAAALMLGGKALLEHLEKQNLLSLYRDVELPVIEVLYDMERTGFLLDLGALADLKKKYDVMEKECLSRIYALAGKEFNMNSPKQLAKILFDELGLEYPKKRGSNGSVSTSAEILAHLTDAHPIIPEVLHYRYLSKINSTYIVGLGKVAGRDGVVHTEFNQMLTATGRLSSSEPNLQNIPVKEEEGKVLRGLFVAREGHMLVSADYSQIELRVMAHLSGDELLIAAYNSGADIHASVAVELFGHPDPTPKERRMAKTVNFGIIYGMSAFGLSERLGINAREAKAYIDKYFERFPGVKKYLDGVVEKAKQTGYAESLFGRRRVIPELRSRDYQQRSFGERAAMNMPMQSTAADIIKVAMLRVSRALEGTNAKLILQVHDELIVDVPEAEAADVAALLKREMESAVRLRVPLVADVHSGRNWLECK